MGLLHQNPFKKAANSLVMRVRYWTTQLPVVFQTIARRNLRLRLRGRQSPDWRNIASSVPHLTQVFLTCASPTASLFDLRNLLTPRLQICGYLSSATHAFGKDFAAINSRGKTCGDYGRAQDCDPHWRKISKD